MMTDDIGKMKDTEARKGVPLFKRVYIFSFLYFLMELIS